VDIAAKDKQIIIVSSTNGKTSTTRLITAAIGEQYGIVISNALGANQKAGIISALVSKENREAKFAVLEIDERSLPTLFDDLSPAYLILGNLSRDQLDRFGEVASIATAWKKMLKDSDVKVIANASDPNIVFATKDLAPQNVTYIELDSNWHDDANTCNICGSLLKWSGNDFACTKCDFKKPSDLVSTSHYDSTIENSLALPGEWNKNNARLALKLLEQIEIAGRNAVFNIGNDRTLQLFLAKNPAGYNELLNFISRSNLRSEDIHKPSTIFAFNCNIADGKDPSWLYDVRFEDFELNTCFVFGQRATDMTLRLKIADKDVAKLNSLNEILKANKSVKHFYLIASYTQFHALSRSLPKQFEVAE
jgi:UDP-N-acetylmuramyl tripeptide synthase